MLQKYASMTRLKLSATSTPKPSFGAWRTERRVGSGKTVKHRSVRSACATGSPCSPRRQLALERLRLLRDTRRFGERPEQPDLIVHHHVYGNRLKERAEASFRSERANESAIGQLGGYFRGDSACDVDASMSKRRERHVARKRAVGGAEDVERLHCERVAIRERKIRDHARRIADLKRARKGFARLRAGTIEQKIENAFQAAS